MDVEDRTSSGTCPRCRALEERVAELERRLGEDGRDPPPFALKAMRVIADGWGEGWGLRPSPARRHWMDGIPRSYQCLPMTVANQWGWQVLCPTDVRASWDGTPGPSGVRVEVDPRYGVAIKSQFGQGIVTFSPPWLFRTPPGWDLYAKGPGNRWKPNCVPLEGIIETWWLNYTFTLNWKVVEPGTVTFARGESLAQLFPVPHGTFQGSSAVEVPILASEPQAALDLMRWRDERRSIADQPDKAHRLYLKAEGIEDHLTKIPVPRFAPVERDDSRT
jgi:hypothetical protein